MFSNISAYFRKIFRKIRNCVCYDKHMDNSTIRNKADELLRESFNKLSDVKTSNLSDKVYHYTSAEGLKGIIENNCLWFSDIEYLNDETEIKYVYNIILDLIKDNNLNLHERLYQFIINRCDYINCSNYFKSELNIALNDRYYIASFSNKRDSLTLWNNYTKSINNTGYNIGFNRSNLLTSIKVNNIDKNDNYIHGNVIYSKNKQLKMLKDLINKFNELYLETFEEHLLFQYLGISLKVYSLFFKKECFKEEDEYRIVIDKKQDIQARDISSSFRVHKGLFIPYIKPSLDKECIEEIYISPTIKEKLYNASVERMLNRYDYPDGIDVINSEIPLRY